MCGQESSLCVIGQGNSGQMLDIFQRASVSQDVAQSCVSFSWRERSRLSYPVTYKPDKTQVSFFRYI